jgi:hypothetical protein
MKKFVKVMFRELRRRRKADNKETFQKRARETRNNKISTKAIKVDRRAAELLSATHAQ